MSSLDYNEVYSEDLGDPDLVFELLSNVTKAAATTALRTDFPSGTTITITGPTYEPGALRKTFAQAVENNTTTEKHSDKYHYYGPVIVGIFCFFLVVFVLLAVLGNSFVILTIVRHRGMRTRTNLLLANLAIADIMVAVLDMPMAMITLIYGEWKFPDSFCYFNGFTVGLGLMLSVHTLMWISIHKYISITRPFSRAFTRRRIGYIIAICWIWAIVYNLTPVMRITKMVYKTGASQCGPTIPVNLQQKLHSYMNTFFNLVLPISVMSYCYYKVFAEVKRHLLRMRDSSNLDFRNTVLQQQRISLTLFIVLACFIICWMPYILYSMILVLGGQSKINIIFNPIAYLFGYMNSACNPIIYAFRSPSFRRGYWDIIYGRRQGVPGTRTLGNRRQSGFLGTFRDPYREAVSERSHRYGNRAVIESEREQVRRNNNLKYKKVVLDQSEMPQGLAKTTSAPDYELGIAIPNNAVAQDDPLLRSTKKGVVQQEAFSEGFVHAYAAHQKICLDSPPRTRHKSDQIGNRQIPEIHLTLSRDVKQRPAFLRRPINHAKDGGEAISVSPTFSKKTLVQDCAHDVPEKNICLFVDPIEELEHEGIDVNILGRRLPEHRRKKSPDEIRSWYSEELLDSEKGRSNDTFDMTSVSASNPNLIKHLGDDKKPEGRGCNTLLGVQGSKIRCNSHREVLLVNSESNLVGLKKTASANDIDFEQDLEGSARLKSVRPRVYTEGDSRWKTSRETRRRLMWQASVEGIGESPLQSLAKLHFRLPGRKIFHIRQVAKSQLSMENQSGSLKKMNEGNFLGIASLLTTLRRSLSDFFSVEPSGGSEDKKKGSSVVPDSCDNVI